MTGSEVLLKPGECTLILADIQAGLAFAIESADRQLLVNNAVALARVATTFKVPTVVTTSASKVYSGPLLPRVQVALPDTKTFERRNMNAWEDDTVRGAILATGQKRLIVAGFLTEACVSFVALSALKEGFELFGCRGYLWGPHIDES
jgi:nicotinamidase-related amidase